ncbi:iron complex transport system permease protein [Simplicispira sp. 125]|nr:iron complex transport system permease protein [Simplicispira sp. 125]PVY55504.1 iron complex transport system permease protein [Simplicispira sp. 125]REG16194.1 iron complex transport system permease protein [Simplicispira sp. 110]REG16447.1 iron complex transport system permease protein [Simplicispira sp. 110]
MTTCVKEAPQASAMLCPPARAIWLPWAVAGVLLAAVVVAAFALGKFPMAPADLLRAVLARITGTESGLSPAQETVVWNIRLPRVAAGLLVGAGLAAAGAAYQGMFRNPLVSPDILGVSAGAGLGAVLGIYLSLPLAVVQALAFVGGLLAVGTVVGVAGLVRRHDPVLVLVLAGIAVGALLGAGISLIKILADPTTQLPSITFWLLGGLNAVTTADLAVTAPVMLVGLVPMALLRWRMNLLSLADEEAQALGISVVRLRLLLVAAATLSTAAAVSLTGIIGWIGLVVPHVARLLVGPNFARLLPASLLLGGGFLVATDTLARTVASIELPLGILTALVGAPFFLFLLARPGRGE